jgi:hypothetical protein
MIHIKIVKIRWQILLKHIHTESWHMFLCYADLIRKYDKDLNKKRSKWTLLEARMSYDRFSLYCVALFWYRSWRWTDPSSKEFYETSEGFVTEELIMIPMIPASWRERTAGRTVQLFPVSNLFQRLTSSMHFKQFSAGMCNLTIWNITNFRKKSVFCLEHTLFCYITWTLSPYLYSRLKY